MEHIAIAGVTSALTTAATLGILFGGRALWLRRRSVRAQKAVAQPARFVRRETAAKEARFRRGPKGHAVIRDAHMSQSRQTWDAPEEQE